MVQGGQGPQGDQTYARDLAIDGPAPPPLDELVTPTGEPTDMVFRVAADQCLYPVALLDHEGVVKWVGWSYERFYGWRREQLVGKSFHHVVAPHSLAEAVDAFANIGDAYEPAPWGGVGLVLDLLRPDGSTVPCEISALSTQRSGLPWYVIYTRQANYETLLDQTVQAMAAGVQLGEVLAHVVEGVARMLPESAVAIGDRWSGDRFDVTAGAAASLLKQHPASPWGRAMSTAEQLTIDCEDMPASLGTLAQAEGYRSCYVQPVQVGSDDRPVAALVVWHRHADQPLRFRRYTLLRCGQLLRLVLQWDRSHRNLEFAATHDPLTGLANRQAFRDRVHTVTRARDGRAAILYLDLDRFKPVNDELGHQAGDRVLAAVAERLVAALRPGDTVARMGGDEFAVLCERLSQPDDIERVADRLLQAVRQPISNLRRGDVRIDASIGIADIAGGERVDTVLARADDAMRAAKQAGRSRWIRSRS